MLHTMLGGENVKHFEKGRDPNYRFLVAHYREWRLYPYTPRKGKCENGVKYRLCEVWYCPEWGEYRLDERYLVHSIREAENIIRGI